MCQKVGVNRTSPHGATVSCVQFQYTWENIVMARKEETRMPINIGIVQSNIINPLLSIDIAEKAFAQADRLIVLDSEKRISQHESPQDEDSDQQGWGDHPLISPAKHDDLNIIHTLRRLERTDEYWSTLESPWS
jgi:hypothetical protein